MRLKNKRYVKSMIGIKWKKYQDNLFSDKQGKSYLDNTRQECLVAMSKIDDISNHKWHFYRKLLNNHDFDSREFAVNRAFYKLWEILSIHKDCLNDVDASLHLAEAPGSFIQVVDKMKQDIKITAISKPPSLYADVVKKGKTIPTFSNSLTSIDRYNFIYSDLLSVNALKNLVEKLLKKEPDKYGFITADGGFDEEEQYDAKEVLHYNLILAEVVSILLLQKKQGSCVLKIFETFTETTISILYLLCMNYGEFYILKPSTSRPTNAEKYLICKNFKGLSKNIKPEGLYSLMKKSIDKTMTLNLTIPLDFLEKIIEASEKYVKIQVDTINSVVSFVEKKEKNTYIDKREYNEEKSKAFQEWKEKYNYVHDK